MAKTFSLLYRRKKPNKCQSPLIYGARFALMVLHNFSVLFPETLQKLEESCQTALPSLLGLTVSPFVFHHAESIRRNVC